jgi:hypothetical protein
MDIFKSNSPVRKPPAASVRSSVRASAPITEGADESTWDSLVAGASSTTKRMSQMFEDATNTRENSVMDKLKTWWEDASEFVQDATSTVGEKLADLQTPAPMADDPLSQMRSEITEYHDALETLKKDTLHFSLLIDGLRAPGQVKSEKDFVTLDMTVAGQYAVLIDVQKEFAASDEVTSLRKGVEKLVEELNEEQQKLESIRQRFRRRDKIHVNVNDINSKIQRKKEKHRNMLAPDPKVLQDIFEMNTQVDELKKEMRVATKAIVTRANESLTKRARRFQEFFTKLIALQRQGFERTAALGQAMGRLLDKVAVNKAATTAPFALPRHDDHDGDDEDEGEQKTP